eukprot:COSAG01_NODE_5198_length_4416_cov_9.375029_3_plen_176_part_00
MSRCRYLRDVCGTSSALTHTTVLAARHAIASSYAQVHKVKEQNNELKIVGVLQGNNVIEDKKIREKLAAKAADKAAAEAAAKVAATQAKGVALAVGSVVAPPVRVPVRVHVRMLRDIEEPSLSLQPPQGLQSTVRQLFEQVCDGAAGGRGYFTIRTEAVTDIPLCFYSFYVFLSY